MGAGRNAESAKATANDGAATRGGTHGGTRGATPEAPVAPLPMAHPVAAGALAETGGLTVELRPDAEERAAIARYLDLAGLEALAFRAEILPHADGWRLEGRLSASVVQTCVVTLEPVPAAIETPMERTYLPGIQPPSESEIELDADSDAAPEPLGEAIDVAAPMIETLALALEPFPRAPGAEHGTRVYGPPGAEPLTDEAARPFAGLAALRARMGGDGADGGES